MRLLADVLSPPRCAACEVGVRRDHVFCAACAATVERCTDRTTSGGARPIARGANDMFSGRANDAFGELFPVDVAFAYYGGALATAIRRLKYEDRPYLARPLGELLRGACRAARTKADLVVPVPLHPRRLVDRGYNQAALLAAHVARELGAPLVTTALARKVETTAQAKLSSAERHANLEGAMVVAARAVLAGRTIALVDDVATTGATLRACRDALLAAGVRTVVGVVLARTSAGAMSIPLGLDSGPVLDIGVNRACAS